MTHRSRENSNFSSSVSLYSECLALSTGRLQQVVFRTNVPHYEMIAEEGRLIYAREKED